MLISYSWLASSSAVYLPAFPIQRSRPTTHEIRKEKRNPQKRQVLLSPLEEPLVTEVGWTENVSPHGLRVLTEWPWPRGAQLTVLSSESELWDRARVVYCQPLSGNLFALGLEFLTRTTEFIMRSSV